MKDLSKSRHVTVLCLAAVGLSGQAGYSQAHDSGKTPPVMTDHCERVKASVEEAGFADRVSVSCDDGHAYLNSSSYPDHELMTGIAGSNEQVPIPAANYAAPVPLDACGGHAGRGDDYHYHATPTCMIDAMENAGDNAIIGWAFDGFPLFGHNNPDGTPISDQALDVCNGQADATFGYRYHTSPEAPYIIQCLMGEVADFESLPRIAPLRPAEGSSPMEPGRPPVGGVDDLAFTQSDSGARSLDYSYKGEAYYIRYQAADTPGCYDMKTKTVTNDGVVKAGVYCR